MTSSLLARLVVLDTCAVSDALDHLGLSGAALGIHAVWGRPKIAGVARTVEVVEAAASGPTGGRHMATEAVASAVPEEVIVIANRGRVDVSCWGDILTCAAQLRGVRGTIIDGACRDVDAIAEAGYPVFARAGVPVTARGRVVDRATDVPVQISGVRVEPGDLVLADGSGVVIVPSGAAEDVISRAESLATRQHAMAEAVRAGRPVVEVMRDENFRAALDGGDR